MDFKSRAAWGKYTTYQFEESEGFGKFEARSSIKAMDHLNWPSGRHEEPLPCDKVSMCKTNEMR